MTRLLLLLALLTTPLSAESGYEYHGDLNADGIPDSIVTGPAELFGTGGGPLVITLSQPGGKTKVMSISGKPGVIALEKGPIPRLYLYLHNSARTGNLVQQDLAGDFASHTIAMQGEDGGTELGDQIFAVIFAKPNLLTFTEVPNYTPPPNPDGQEWGK
jgi:hypothetical protein